MKYVKDHKGQTTVVLIFLGLAILALHLSFAYESDQWIIKDSQVGRFLAHTLINIAPELAGIVIGVVTIDYLNEKRQEKQLKKQLILQMRSKHNDVSDTAVSVLKSYGWLSDGTLEEADLTFANLSGAYLGRADLTFADLTFADLSGAYLGRADLSGADLSGADLSGADLGGAFLSEACLYGAKNWARGQLLQAISLAEATMPDGRKYEEWIQDQDREGQIDKHAVAEIGNALAINSASAEE